MWHEIGDNVMAFMEQVDFFHDSCIKEIHYVSGAYVNEKLAMYPVNEKRTLRVVVQRQAGDDSMIEMEFAGLRFLKLFPANAEYTCEILDATMIIKDGLVYWFDCGGLTEADIDTYEGTAICAERFRWRSISGCMGQKEFYSPII